MDKFNSGGGFPSPPEFLLAIDASICRPYTRDIMGNEFFNQASVLGAPTQATYRDLVRQQQIPRGSTTAVALPQPIPGFVVGRSTLEGAPVGWNSKAIASIINIDPDVQGEGFTLDLSTVTADAFSKATDAAQIKQAVSIDDLRNRASSVFRSLARDQTLAQPASPPSPPPPPQEGVNMETPPASGMTPALDMAPAQPLLGHSSQPVPPAASPQGPPSTIPNPHSGQTKAASFVQPAAPASAPTSAPAPAAPFPLKYQALGGEASQLVPPQGNPASLFDQLSTPQALPGPSRPGRAAGSAPTYKVTFEVQGAPMSIETWYHDVIRDEHVLVLVYDTSCVGYPRSRLQPTDSDIAVHIDGSDSIYLVQDPSITFEFGDQEFQVLLIKAEHPYASAAATVE